MTTYKERHASIWASLLRLANQTSRLMDMSPELKNRTDIKQRIAEIGAEIARQEVEFNEEDIQPPSDQQLQIELLRQNQESMDRSHRQTIRLMLLIAQKNKWLNHDDIDQWVAENP